MAAFLHALESVVDRLVDLHAEYLVLPPVFLLVHVHAYGKAFELQILLVVKLDLLQHLLLLLVVEVAQLLCLHVFFLDAVHLDHATVLQLRISCIQVGIPLRSLSKRGD